MYSGVADITACWHFAFLCEFSLFFETTLVTFSGAPWQRGARMRLQGLGSFLVSVGSLGASF